jgi:hypothetical protein
MALWSELWFAFREAYRTEPPDEGLMAAGGGTLRPLRV